MADAALSILFEKVFESLARENGKRTWSARTLMGALGYDNWSVFKKVIYKAISACALLNIPVLQHFTETSGDPEDFQLSRLACGMTALNADSNKVNVAAAQVYFVSILEVLIDLKLHHAEIMDRLAIREEISEREVTLAETAAAAGVDSYSGFSIAGYIGMYDMDYQSLRRLRGVSELPNRSVLDFMGKDELAGNLFRLALTEGRVRKEGTRGQRPLERVAKEVGRRVRNTMHDETGVYPEQLPTAQDIREVRRGLKSGSKKIGILDDLTKERAAEQRFLTEASPERPADAVPGCPECAGGNLASHHGSPNCTSGSLASGGSISHCTCDYCF